LFASEFGGRLSKKKKRLALYKLLKKNIL